MATKRMFSMQIVDSDAFLSMPMSTQCLYFHLCMRADDDGFCGSAQRIARMIGAAEDDLKLLIAKRFILYFDTDGVIVIKHWRMHNCLTKDRYKETAYLEDKQKLFLKDNGSYSLEEGTPIDDTAKLISAKRQSNATKDGCIVEQCTPEENRRTKDAQQTDADKNRLDKNRSVKNINDCPSADADVQTLTDGSEECQSDGDKACLSKNKTINDKEINNSKAKKRKVKEFVKPSLDDIIKYKNEAAGSPVSAKEFFYYYTDKEWAGVKNWKLTFNVWERKQDFFRSEHKVSSPSGAQDDVLKPTANIQHDESKRTFDWND